MRPRPLRELVNQWAANAGAERGSERVLYSANLRTSNRSGSHQVNEQYADTAQARQLDRDLAARYQEVNPVNTIQPFAPVVRCEASEAAAKAKRRDMILGAMGKMEDMLGMPRK